MSDPIRISRQVQVTKTEDVLADHKITVSNSSRIQNFYEAELVTCLERILKASQVVQGKTPVTLFYPLDANRTQKLTCEIQPPQWIDEYDYHNYFQRTICESETLLKHSAGVLSQNPKVLVFEAESRGHSLPTDYVSVVDDPATPYHTESATIRLYEYVPEVLNHIP